MRISDWSSDVCSSDLYAKDFLDGQAPRPGGSAGVPGPSAATQMGCHTRNVGSDHIVFGPIMFRRLAGCCVPARIDPIEQRHGAVTITLSRNCDAKPT